MRLRLAMSLLIGGAAIPAHGQDIDCSDPGNLPQQHMNFCAARTYERTDRAMNVAWKKLRATGAGRRGEGDPLLRAQKAWITFRDAQCEAETAQFEGGSIRPLLVSGCLERLTTLRTQDLLLMMPDDR